MNFGFKQCSKIFLILFFILTIIYSFFVQYVEAKSIPLFIPYRLTTIYKFLT